MVGFQGVSGACRGGPGVRPVGFSGAPPAECAPWARVAGWGERDGGRGCGGARVGVGVPRGLLGDPWLLGGPGGCQEVSRDPFGDHLGSPRFPRDPYWECVGIPGAPWGSLMIPVDPWGSPRIHGDI